MSIAIEYSNIRTSIANLDNKIMVLQEQRQSEQRDLAILETKLADSVGNNIRQRAFPASDGKVIVVTYYPKGDATDSFVGVKILSLETQ